MLRVLRLDAPLFSTLRDGLARLPMLPERLPTVAELDAALSPLAGVHFEPQAPRPRFGPPTVRYDSRIVEGIVPTREGNCHDAMNALMWSCFPLSKRALHERQASCIKRRQGANRTAEEDTLAMLDEGGVLVRLPPSAPTAIDRLALASLLRNGDAQLIIFGHAVYECVALQRELVPPRAALLQGAQPWDQLFAQVLSDPQRFLHKSELVQVPLEQLGLR